MRAHKGASYSAPGDLHAVGHLCERASRGETKKEQRGRRLEEGGGSEKEKEKEAGADRPRGYDHGNGKYDFGYFPLLPRRADNSAAIERARTRKNPLQTAATVVPPPLPHPHRPSVLSTRRTKTLRADRLRQFALLASMRPDTKGRALNPFRKISGASRRFVAPTRSGIVEQTGHLRPN